jgi:hypothetical protein
MFNAICLAPRRAKDTSIILLAVLAFAAGGCKYIIPVDTTPLDAASVNYDSIQQLKALKITTPEVAELAKAKQGHLSDSGCVEVFKIFHSRGAAFNAGDAIASLIQVGTSEDTILQLAKLNQLGLGTGELQAMRLAGLSDAIVLAVAGHRAEGKPVLSGASLAKLKNNGLRESTLLELAQRGIPDSQAGAIISFSRGGTNDAEVLRRFTGS